MLTTSGVLTMHGFSFAVNLVYVGLMALISSMSFWFRDVISEATYMGDHTLAVQRGLNMGVALFIVSEAFFFIAIFWTFFQSALSPGAEMGAQWPPMGIDSVNPFELPLLNTIILLSSGFTVTYAHHSLIQGNRYGALMGTSLTVVLALIFTLFQGIEYTVSSFTLSDSTYGSCFYFGTGFHGLIIICVAPFIYIYTILKIKETYKFLNNNIEINNDPNINNNLDTNNNIDINNNTLLITIPSKYKQFNSHYLEKNFIEWFVGFVDAEGNFNIKITALSNNTFKYVQFTFQICLHKDEEQVINYIMDTVKCGHISRSNDKINYFVNDINSLLYVIIPIFDYVNLNSSKYHHFLLWRKAVFLKKDINHIDNGKLEIINLEREMQNMSGRWVPSSINSKINITKHWLAGFIEGDGSFSYNKYVPRFRLENHYKELELYNKIKEFLTVGNVMLTSPRINRINSNPTIVLEINKIKQLKDILIPLMFRNDCILLKSLKTGDFLLWLKLIDIYYKGYHTITEGKYAFDTIKLHINRYRLTTNFPLLQNEKCISVSEIENLLCKLYLLDSPYEIKQGIRCYRNTDKLVSEATNIIVIDSSNNKSVYNSISDCAKNLHISRKNIKHCLNTGESYKEHIFVLS